ncbi:acetyl-CoA carboxylase, partial [Syncephalis pseudoplumigaleata]
MFKKLLVANRGEIACRILGTCRRLGIATVAVYSDSDKEAPHTRLADEAVYIGASPATDSYLRGDLIIAAAKQTGADALHPGYGFLSENAAFAQACLDAGIVFIGPKPASINAIGDKISAKQLLKERAPTVPLIPGYNGDDQSNERLMAEAVKMGFPVLLKASAGGGGKGMRVVRAKEHLLEEIELAKSEARRSFGSDALLVERYFDRGRHIEASSRHVQIIGDQQGNVHHIYERECTIQRRHQKIIEEAPSAVMTESLRARMTDAAICIGRLIQYEGVGTVEFIVDDATHEFYFLEVNTRLQVEHPVTESVTGLDLVELQMHVASETPVPAAPIKGHAIECRLYAEDPSQNFMPCKWWWWWWWWASTDGTGPAYAVRIGSGPAIGSMVTIYYDPMIAKVTVWAETRALAIQRMQRALEQTQCLGLVTNQGFLLAILNHPRFAQGAFTTQFVEE